MTEQEREQFYDDEIAPALLDLMRRCTERGLSFLAVVEWAPEANGRTRGIVPGSGLGIRFADAAVQAGNNVDALFFAIAKYAHQHGHSSIFLSQMGVPLQPEAARNP